MKESQAKTKREVFGRLLLLSFTALVLALSVTLYAASSFGWFAKTFHVDGTDMNLKARNDFFNLAVSGDQVSPYVSGDAIVEYLALSENGGYQKLPSTDSTRQSLLCRMSNENPHVSESEEIAPGAYGKISFDIVPGESGRTAFNISINLIAFGSDNGTPAAIDPLDADELDALLSGHILLYLDRSSLINGGYYYSDRIVGGSFVYDITEHTPTAMADGDHYTVEIYWIWPATFAQFALGENNPKLHSHSVYGNYTATGGDTVSGETERAEILEHIKTNTTEFFKNLNPAVSFTRTDYEDYFFVELTDAYNLADQFIGEKAQYLIVEANVY